MTTQNQSSAQIPKTESDMDRLLQKPHASLETYVNKSPDPVRSIEAFGKWIAKSGMFKCQREEQGMIIAIACIEMGIGLVEFGQTFDVMHDGRLRKKALAAHAEFEALGGFVRWLDTGDNGSRKAEAELEFKGNKRVFKFTMEDAERAGIVKKGGAWESWQSEMLCARVLSRGIARVCPKIYAGFATEDDDSLPTLVLPEAKAPVAEAKAEVKAESKVETEPVQEKQAETVQSAPAHVDGLISIERANEVAAALGDSLVKAIMWMKKPSNGWLTQDQIDAVENPLIYLTELRATKILSRLDSFIKAINNPAGSQ